MAKRTLPKDSPKSKPQVSDDEDDFDPNLSVPVGDVSLMLTLIETLFAGSPERRQAIRERLKLALAR